jgi:virulence factor Mce-like protein
MSATRRIAFLALGAAVAAAAVILVTGASGGYYVRAELRDAGGLRKNSSVKVHGVPAGKVTGLTVNRSDVAIATLSIDGNAVPIGRGASIKVRPTDLLGERYAELSPGDAAHPLPSGSTIPMSRSSQPVELDDVLNMLDPNTRARLGILINEFGVALDGRGTDFNRLLATMPSSLDRSKRLIDQVAQQSAALKRLVVKGDRITAAVNGRRDDMGRLLDEASAALSGVAERRQALGATIRSAPGALGQLRDTLGRLDTAAQQLRPTATALTAAAAPLDSTLRELPAFAEAAAPTLETARTVAPALTRLGVQATPAVARLRPTARLLTRTLKPAGPALDQMDRRGTDDLLYFINNMNLGLAGRDGIGHFIGAQLTIDPEYISNAIGAFQMDGSPNVKQGGATPPASADPGRTPSPVTTPPVKAPDVHVPNVHVPGVPVPSVPNAVPPVHPPSVPGGDALRLFNYLMAP